MRALVFNGQGSVCHETLEDPKLVEPTDVLVEVEISAICGSDLHVYHGREKGIDHGTVMGHEFVGRVAECGKDVKDLKPGARVFSPFTTSCGECFYCRRGLTARCESGQLFGWVEQGAGLHGAQAETVRVPLAASTLVEIPNDVTPEEGLLLGDVLSTGYYCAKQAGVEPGGVYAIVGCGPVGLMAIAGALELGAETLFAIDSIPERLDLAARLGATPISYAQSDPRAIVHGATQGRGADAVLELVGNSSAHRLAVNLVRPGGTVSVVGVHNEERFAFTPAEAYDKNLTYRVGRCPARHMIPQLIPMVQSKKYDLAAVISHRMTLSEGPGAYKLFDEKREGCTKVVLTP
ncbi:MAG: alcohol dehydrogenase catalytic domain-containing protein [bacterium]|nr:alcohol dehydrogenase catalytic domain-containing protein [bacterium]